MVFITVAGLAHKGTTNTSSINSYNEIWKFSSRFSLNMPCTVTGIDEALEDDDATDDVASIYPNPTGSDFTIEHKGEFVYIIYNMKGSKLEEGASNGKTTLGSALPQGIYLVKIKDDITEKTIKLVKKQ